MSAYNKNYGGATAAYSSSAAYYDGQAAASSSAPAPNRSVSPTAGLQTTKTGKLLDQQLTQKLSQPKMEIRVGLLGNVSAGKTTLLNALFKDKYGEVSMKRCTAGINFFHLSRDIESANNGQLGTGSSVFEARSICSEIKQANTTLREKPKIEEKHFAVRSLGDSIVTMDPKLPDLELVVVDVPGLNESGTSSLYKNYVKENFASFDYVMIIMDVNQGVNTDEQVGLLEFVKSNCREVRDIPVCVIINKVDQSADEEVLEMCSEIEEKVAQIFGEDAGTVNMSDVAASGGNNIAAAKGITTSSVFQNVSASAPKPAGLKTVSTDKGRVGKLVRGSSTSNADALTSNGSQSDVSCVALSAEYGYIYRAASQLGKTQFFEFLDKKYVDKIGMSEFGRQWGRWSEHEKLENVYRVVTDPTEYKQRLKECNFSALLKELEENLGADKQVALISRQIEFALDQLLKNRGAEIDFVSALCECYDKSMKVRDSPLDGDMLMKTFWRLFEAKVKKSEEKFLTEASRAPLVECMDYALRYYDDLVTERLGRASQEEVCAVQKAMKKLVQSQMRWLCRKMRACDFGSKIEATAQHTTRRTAWGKFSTMAFHNITESILLVQQLFPQETAKHFPQELIELKYNAKLMFSIYANQNPVDKCKAATKKSAKSTSKDDVVEKLPHPGWFQPLELYGGDFSNPRHWGFISMKFLEFLQREGDVLIAVEKAEEAAKLEEVTAAVIERAVSRQEDAKVGGPPAKKAKRG